MNNIPDMDNLALNQFLAMKRNISILSLLGAFAVLFVGAMILSSCEGPQGPQGPPGADGKDGIDGTNGTDGTNGVDGNAVCLVCHNLTTKAEITAAWETSGHGLGVAASGHAGNDVGCTVCHSTEGFIERIWTGQDTTAAPIPFPTPIGCKACHDFHSSLDFENEMNHAIRTTDPVALLGADLTVQFENDPESNLCMNCHQARRAAPADSVATAYFMTNSHYGAHHGPQASVLNGVGGYEYRTDLSAASPHESGASCIVCHMAETDADTTGGHTWVPDEAVCLDCHDALPEAAMAALESKLEELKTTLITAGLLDAAGAIVVDSFQADSVGALWNYLLIEEDRSMGIHNPDYATALMNASIMALQ